MSKKNMHYSSFINLSDIEGNEIAEYFVAFDINPDGFIEYECSMPICELNDLDQEAVSHVFGRFCKSQSDGICTWSDLSSDMQKDFERIAKTEEDKFLIEKAKIISRTVFADGYLIRVC